MNQNYKHTDFTVSYSYVTIHFVFVGEMWIGITLAVIVELVPIDIRTSAIALYLFIITNIGGNIQLVVPSIKDRFLEAGYSKSDALRSKSSSQVIYKLFIFMYSALFDKGINLPIYHCFY